MLIPDAILDAFATKQQIPPFTDSDPAFTEAIAYGIAAEIHERRVMRGEHPVGRKIGFTNKTIWELYDVWSPIWGYVYDTTLHRATSGRCELSVSHLIEPRIEPEIQLHFAKTPPVTDDEEAILASIDWIAHGFEIVQSPYPGWRFGLADTIAACALHGALVIGDPVPVKGVDYLISKLRSFTITISRDGVEVATGGGANVLDSPLLAFGHLARTLEDQKARRVMGGEIVTTGTLTDAYPVAPGETWSTTLDGLPVPGVEVTFT